MAIQVKNCRDITRLISEAGERKLTLVERITVRIHVILCGPCNNYRAQLGIMKKFCARLRREQEQPASHTLPEDSRKRILDKLTAK